MAMPVSDCHPHGEREYGHIGSRPLAWEEMDELKYLATIDEERAPFLAKPVSFQR
jgi:hypothetical protein